MEQRETGRREGINQALALAAASFGAEGLYREAYYLYRLLLERGEDGREILEHCVDCADKAGLVPDCLDLLTGLACRDTASPDLLHFAAGLLGGADRKEESRVLAIKAAASKPFFPSRVRAAKLRLLVLQCAGTGDYRYSPRSRRFFMPGISDLYTLLDPQVACDRLLVDDPQAALDALESLPSCDLIFNAISDPDYRDCLDNAAAVCGRAGLPVFNPPERVRAVNRESLPGLAAACVGVVAARSIYLPPEHSQDQDVTGAMREHGLEYPVIVRAPGFQGGRHMALLSANGPGLGGIYRGNGLYLIEFMDVSFTDPRAPGVPLYPKYRAFYVNGELYPMHLFIADNYEVHKKTADPALARYPWLPEREADFLADPAAHLPEGRWEQLRAAMASFGLDYAGVDFAVSSDPADQGRLVLFECNPSMRNWLTLLPEGDRVQRKWREVTLAALEALCAKAGVRPWPFVLKKGR